MTDTKLTIHNFISYARCETLFHHLKNPSTDIEEDPDLLPLLKQFCATFKDILIDSSAKPLTAKSILKKQKNITQPLALLLPKFEFNNFLFQPHILYIDHTSIDVYILSPAHYVSRYFTYILGLWKFGFDNINLPISRFMSISIKDKKSETDSFFHLKFESNRVFNTQSSIKKQYHSIQTLLAKTQTSQTDIGKHCFKPSKCDFFKTCWKIDSPNIFDCVEYSFLKKLELFKKNITSFNAIKKHTPDLSDRQIIQLNAELSQNPYIDHQALQKFFQKLIFPIQCLDIEVITNTLPIIDRFKTFEKVPFLFSLHTLPSFDVNSTHTDFFTPINKQTLRLFAEALITSLDKHSSIIVYDSMLENIIFEQLSVACPDLKDDLTQLKRHIIDISTLFKSYKVYIPGMLGKFSLKAIHGSINKTHNHQLLDLKSGSDALHKIKLYLQSAKQDQASLEKELRDYCKMDTFALIEILTYLNSYLN